MIWWTGFVVWRRKEPTEDERCIDFFVEREQESKKTFEVYFIVSRHLPHYTSEEKF